MLLRDEYIAALTHDHRVVRNNALGFIVQCKAGGLDVTRQALRALEEHGVQEAFLYNHHLVDLPLEREEAEKLLDLLANRKHTIIPHLALEWLIFKAPVDFLRDQEKNILNLAVEFQAVVPKGFVRDELDERFRLDQTPLPDLLAELDRLAAEAAEDSSYEAETLIEFLGDHPEVRSELESRADSWLAKEIADEKSDDDPEDKNFWTVSNGVHIARKLRLTRTIPTLLDLLKIDSDFMDEWVVDALIEMNSLETLETWGAVYPDLDWGERLYLSGTCDHISESGVDAFLERLLEKETDPDVEERIMIALSMQPSARATQRCADHYRENSGNPDAGIIAENLFTRHTILGLDHPDFELWREDSEFQHDRTVKNFRRGIDFNFPSSKSDDEDFSDFLPPLTEPAVPFVAPDKPNRNDPCPCGSGKKYKKCCLATGA